MGDSHDSWEELKKAVAIADEQGCEHLLFGGDLIAPNGFQFLEAFSGKVHFVWGNNDGEKYSIMNMIASAKNAEHYDHVFEMELNGVKFFMNHYPRLGELAAKSGEFDVAVYCHTHEYDERMIGETLLLNPGCVQAKNFRNIDPSFVIYDTQSRTVERFML